jgi:hypothetical protein
MVELTRWLSPAAAAWCRENDRFEHVYPAERILLARIREDAPPRLIGLPSVETVFRPLDAPPNHSRFFRQPDARPPLFWAVEDHAGTASCPSVLIASCAAGEIAILQRAEFGSRRSAMGAQPKIAQEDR